MRTTVEITEEQHRALSALAQRRGLRGFSALVQEALTTYLAELDTDELDLLLGLEGILDQEEEREVRARIDAARATWRAS
jgi:metal-responsive CopG/Arc/MetJ family transcriptional regulator